MQWFMQWREQLDKKGFAAGPTAGRILGYKGHVPGKQNQVGVASNEYDALRCAHRYSSYNLALGCAVRTTRLLALNIDGAARALGSRGHSEKSYASLAKGSGRVTASDTVSMLVLMCVCSCCSAVD
jgi:hypothetical protein